jgi:zinc-ribbon domain
MSVTVECQKCGSENRLGQLFCRECGAKLDLSKLTPEGVSRKRNAIGFSGVVARMVRIVISLALVTILGLLCWSAPATGDVSSADGAQIIRGKLSALRGAVLARVDARESLAEADINAYLNTVLTGGTKSPGRLTMRLAEIRLDIHPEYTDVLLKATLGPMPITYLADVVIKRDAGGRFSFTPGEVRIGRLPVPGPVRTKVLGQMASTFQNLQEEYTLFNRLAKVEFADGEVKVASITK